MDENDNVEGHETWVRLDTFCRARVNEVACEKPSVLIVSTFEHGWVSLCDGHGILFAARENAVLVEEN